MSETVGTGLGYIQSPYDIRDYKVKADPNEALPDSYILDFSNISVKNQGIVSSCTAHAMSTILEYHAKGNYNLSTNFFYGLQKSICGHDGKGMYLRDACKLAVDYGDPLLEDCWGNYEIPLCRPVAESAFRDREAMRCAADFRMKAYYYCIGIEDIKYALVHYGPVIIGAKWYPDYTVKNGVLVKTSNKKSNGSHALVIYGYNEQGFLCQNSWGELWGDKGRFLMPYEFKITEARGLIDMENDSYIAPPNPHPFINLVLKCINKIVNLFRKK